MSRPKIEWMPEHEAAKKIGYTPRTLRRYAKSGKLDIAYSTTPGGRAFHYNLRDIEKTQLQNSNIINN